MRWEKPRERGVGWGGTDIFRPLKGREGRLTGGCGRRPCSPSSFHSAPLGAPLFRLQHHDTKVSGDFSFSLPRTCFSSCLPAENSLLVFFLNLIFSGSEPRSKEEILSSPLGIIPRISHWKCIHNYQSYFFSESHSYSLILFFSIIAAGLRRSRERGKFESAFGVAD